MTGDALAVPEFSPGARLFGRLSLVCPVGAGSLSAVWFARDEECDRYVALKLFPPLLATDLALIEDLHREIARSRARSQPAAVEIYDVLWDDTLLGVVCEHVEGETFTELRAMLPGGVFQPSQLAGWVVQLCEALETLHADGRVHGDLHPGCLLGELTGRLRILDLGIARPLAESVRLASMSSRYGALAFQSPQRREGGPVLRSDDLFAVGATLYDLLSGRPPSFEPSLPKIAAQRAASKIRGEPISSEWEDAIAACLATNPSERPGSAAALAGLLGLTVAPALVTATAPLPSPRLAESPMPPPRNRRRRKAQHKSASRFAWTLFWLAAFGSLAAVSKLAWVLTTEHDRPISDQAATPVPSTGPGKPAFRIPMPRASAALSRDELRRIGDRVWTNECGHTVEGLTAWNKGEAFASMGIGHFIWYPEKVTGPFQESFPTLLKYLGDHGERIPDWVPKFCPWNTREQFMAATDSGEMKSLRELLRRTVDRQAEFLAARLEKALVSMEGLTPAQTAVVQNRYLALAESGGGMFAMIDYVNFKGEGTNRSERYHGEGWGLVQVLLAMKGQANPVPDFSAAAGAVLDARVKNAPPERHEERWLPGWKSRVRSYGE